MPAGFVMVLAAVVPAGCGVAVSRLTERCRGTGPRGGGGGGTRFAGDHWPLRPGFVRVFFLGGCCHGKPGPVN
ncbi:MAG: hypothetical protein OXC57_11040, partial [Rhodobacteraceae bacterium]|nr:hypothetical protein [Paracoccaceae bacterium]